jgi:hypothetical protein
MYLMNEVVVDCEEREDCIECRRSFFVWGCRGRLRLAEPETSFGLLVAGTMRERWRYIASSPQLTEIHSQTTYPTTRTQIHCLTLALLTLL